MQIQQLNRTDAEKVYVVVKNLNATTATTGFGMRIVGGAAAEIVSTDGVGAVFSADAAMAQFAGIAAEDIAVNGYGRVQAYGYVNSIAYSAIADTTVGVTGIAGSFLKAGGVAGTWVSAQTPQALSTYAYKYVQAWTTVNVSSGVPYGSGFVRAL